MSDDSRYKEILLSYAFFTIQVAQDQGSVDTLAEGFAKACTDAGLTPEETQGLSKDMLSKALSALIESFGQDTEVDKEPTCH